MVETLRCLLFHEFSRIFFLTVLFLTGHEQRSSPCQISRESKRGKICRNMRKTCCKIVENSFFKCFIGLVILLSTGALVSDSMWDFYGKNVSEVILYQFMRSPCQISFPQKTYYSTKVCILWFYSWNIHYSSFRIYICLIQY